MSQLKFANLSWDLGVSGGCIPIPGIFGMVFTVQWVVFRQHPQELWIGSANFRGHPTTSKPTGDQRKVILSLYRKPRESSLVSSYLLDIRHPLRNYGLVWYFHIIGTILGCVSYLGGWDYFDFLSWNGAIKMLTASTTKAGAMTRTFALRD